jgi:hypothetical protein
MSCCQANRERGGSLFLIFGDGLSDLPFVERFWRSHSEWGGAFHSIAARHWEMDITRCEGRT